MKAFFKQMKLQMAVVLVMTSLVGVGIPAAQAATIYTFSVAGASSRLGPTQTQINTAYSGTNLAGLVTINTQGIQEWSVPFTGQYKITAKGAGGGTGFYASTYQPGGLGAQTVGTFTLTAGTVLKIVVGQRGESRSANGGGGGGGGSFVVTSTGTILTIGGGGGGGGGRLSSGGVNASLTTSATLDGTSLGIAGTNGGGGEPVNSVWNGAGGAGYSGNGIGYGNALSFYGYSFTNGATGGLSNGTYPAAGGFGGGGGAAYAGGGGGGYNGAPGGTGNDPYPGGGGGSTYNSGSYVTTSQALSLADGSVSIESLGPSVTNFSPRSSITNSSTITYDVIFSEAVSGLTSSDFSVSGSGSSTCVIGAVQTTSSTNYSISLSSCSPGSISLTLLSNAAANSSSQNVPTSDLVSNTVILDQSAPTISSVTAPGNATYKPSDTPTFTMVFSESVTVTGTPRLTLTVGALTKYATYVSMTDSKTALFRYTVGTTVGEFDTDGIAVGTTLDLNGGAIADLATNSLSPLTFTAPTLTSVLVAQPPSPPTISSITATSGQLSVAFTAGAANGSTTSTYQYSTNNGSTWNNRASGTTASPLVITGLTDGTAYTVRLRAVSNAGNSDSSTAMIETPTSISITGDSTLVLTYGNSASTSAYSATGGTGTYTWTLGSSISGVTISGTTVTASTSTSAGTYSQTVRATDGNSQVGTKVLTITVNKASSSISIALPNSATTAAASGTVVITATVSRAGTVNFKLGGSTISGCGAASAVATTATCSWTAPGTLGSVNLTADFTPSDSSNYETSTSTTLTINVVNGVSSVTLSLTGGVTQVPKGQNIVISAVIDQAGRLSFFVDGKRLTNCYNKTVAAGTRTCTWKPAVQKEVTITATLNPTNSVYQNSSDSIRVWVVRRSGNR